MSPLIIIYTALELLLWAIFLEVILSWMPTPRQRGFYLSLRQLLSDLTGPLLAPIRKVMPPTAGSLDFSPFVAVLVIEIVRNLIRGML